ncbi:MAG: HEAT repeat domain-containing protein [Candidatus Brocadiia bacterium]
MTEITGKPVLPVPSDRNLNPRRRSFPSRGFVLALALIAVFCLTAYFGFQVYQDSTAGLIRALDGNFEVSGAAREKLAARGASVVPALFERMDGSQSPGSVFAESTISFIGKPAVPFLLEKLRSPEHSVATRAALVLGHLGEREAVPELVACLATNDEELRIRCIKALGTAGGDAALSSLISLTQDPSTSVRIAVSSALAQFQDSKAGQALESMLDDADSSVRVNACQGLSLCLCPNATPEIARLASDASPGVRKMLAAGLGAQNDAQSVTILESLLRDPTADVRSAAMISLFWKDLPISLRSLVEAAHDPDESIRIMAIGAIAAQATPDALSLLAELMKADRDEVAWGISQMPSNKMGTFLGLLVSDDPAVRADAFYVISRAEVPYPLYDLPVPVREVIAKFGDTWSNGRFLDSRGEYCLQSLLTGDMSAEEVERELRAEFGGKAPTGRKAIIEWLEDLLIQRQMILRGEGR